MPGTWASLHCNRATEPKGSPGGKGRRTHRTTNGFRCGEDSIPAVDPDIGPRVAALRKGTMRLMTALRQTCARPADHNQLLLCRRCLPFFTKETCPPLPELPPDVSTATHCPPASGGWTSSCPTCGRVRLSVHSMRAHARRAQPGVQIVGESLTCGCRDCFTVILTGASRAGCHRKRQACLQARHAGRANAGTRGGPGASATASSQTPRAADPPTDHRRLRFIHCGNAQSLGIWTATVWDCPSPHDGPYATE
ncbi:hypothetical protein TCDM_11306 [Trypanosoma cruzi Dm28c]|uniref:Uncharacterized protein n=1 Tax=Trypanosoma cruzi Dm28c TaxID=1416333 RepID=V5B0S6_TRYCR|nr:hypothetical protein TCDM_11306 [Trypanosoma cruzi Dm28c]